MKREQLRLYAVTDRACIGERDFFEVLEQALAGGVTLLQLREKHLPEPELQETALRTKDLCRRYGVPLIINDNYRLALEVGADGVHVGAEDAPVGEIRKLAGQGFIIGATAKTIEQAQKAEADGADYLGVGAVFPSPTKTSALRITPAQLRTICASVQIPAVAIGGISADNLHEIRGCGMAGIAVVSAVFGAEDVKAAAARLKNLSGGVL